MMPAHRSWPRRTERIGFTLLEVLIAIALMGGVLTAAFSLGLGVQRARQRAEEFTARSDDAQAVMDAFEECLASIAAPGSMDGSSIRGDASSLAVAFRAVPIRASANLARSPAAHVAALRRSFHFDHASGGVTIDEREFNAPAPMSADDDRPIEGFRSAVEEAEPIEARHVYQVGELRFRYHDGRGWRDSFDSANARSLPLAIEVRMWFDSAARPSEVQPENPLREAGSAEAGFDEDAAVDRTERLIEAEPLPDRVRIISLAQAAAPMPDSASDLAGTGSSAEAELQGTDSNAGPSTPRVPGAQDEDERDSRSLEHQDA